MIFILYFSNCERCVFYRVPYQDIFGGATAFTGPHFQLVNGFSNQYYGWGGEDDDIFKRYDPHTCCVFPLGPVSRSDQAQIPNAGSMTSGMSEK